MKKLTAFLILGLICSSATSPLNAFFKKTTAEEKSLADAQKKLNQAKKKRDHEKKAIDKLKAKIANTQSAWDKHKNKIVDPADRQSWKKKDETFNTTMADLKTKLSTAESALPEAEKAVAVAEQEAANAQAKVPAKAK